MVSTLPSAPGATTSGTHAGFAAVYPPAHLTRMARGWWTTRGDSRPRHRMAEHDTFPATQIQNVLVSRPPITEIPSNRWRHFFYPNVISPDRWLRSRMMPHLLESVDAPTCIPDLDQGLLPRDWQVIGNDKSDAGMAQPEKEDSHNRCEASKTQPG